MATFTTDIDFLIALELEQEYIIEHFMNEQEQNDIYKLQMGNQLSPQRILCEEEINILLDNGINMKEILTLYPGTNANTMNCVKKASNNKTNDSGWQSDPIYKTNDRGWLSDPMEYNLCDAHIYDMANNDMADDFCKNVDKYAKLLNKLNKIWHKSMNHQNKDLIIKKFAFHYEMDGDEGDVYKDYYNALWGELKIGSHTLSVRVIEIFGKHRDNAKRYNYKFEVAIDRNGIKLQRTEEILTRYMSLEIANIIMFDMLDYDDHDTYSHLWDKCVFEQWMPIYFNGALYNEVNGYFESHQMEKCFQYTKMLKKFMKYDTLSNFKTKYETNYTYSSC